jgi:geranylgeranyl pyrophosphate synthase
MALSLNNRPPDRSTGQDPRQHPDQSSKATGPDPSTDSLGEMFGIDDLPARLDAIEDKITSTLGGDGALLGPASTRVSSAGGKRLRPLLAVASAAVGDTFDERAIAAAAAVELVQAGSLVHDDILDEADSRRGSPTINAVEGINHAVLAGDYMLARAAELAASVSREAAELLARTISELCEGQVLELRDSYNPDREIDAYLGSIRGKTAALFECSCRLGAHCAGLSPENVAALGRFGDAFGMSFQVLDDVLDLVADPVRLGKPTGNDVLSGVYTLPVLVALDSIYGEELRLNLAELSSDDASSRQSDADGLTQVLHLVQRSGGISDALATMDRHADQARRAVAHLDQTTIGEGLVAFPDAYNSWALDHFVDASLLDLPLVKPARASA